MRASGAGASTRRQKQRRKVDRDGNRTAEEVLGVPHNASANEIRQAFRKQALQKHPDTLGGNSSDFAVLVQARDTLLYYCNSSSLTAEDKGMEHPAAARRRRTSSRAKGGALIRWDERSWKMVLLHAWLRWCHACEVSIKAGVPVLFLLALASAFVSTLQQL